MTVLGKPSTSSRSSSAVNFLAAVEIPTITTQTILRPQTTVRTSKTIPVRGREPALAAHFSRDTPQSTELLHLHPTSLLVTEIQIQRTMSRCPHPEFCLVRIPMSITGEAREDFVPDCHPLGRMKYEDRQGNDHPRLPPKALVCTGQTSTPICIFNLLRSGRTLSTRSRLLVRLIVARRKESDVSYSLSLSY